MEITTFNKTSAYSRAETVSKNFDTFKNNPNNSSSYKVSLSAKGRQQSVASFNQSQRLKKNAFLRQQEQDLAANNRRLENEKKSFERTQASAERKFDNTQNLKKMEFMRNNSRFVA
jgi:hypothetical protein